MARWVLYGTAACHLCERAEALLAACGLAYDFVDIAADSGLTERYGVRIPVLADRVGGRELGWPFDERSLRDFLEAEEAP